MGISVNADVYILHRQDAVWSVSNMADEVKRNVPGLSVVEIAVSSILSESVKRENVKRDMSLPFYHDISLTGSLLRSNA